MKRTEDSLRDLWENIKRTNIPIIVVPEEEEKKKRYEKIFEEVVVENFPNMEKELALSIREKARKQTTTTTKEKLSTNLNLYKPVQYQKNERPKQQMGQRTKQTFLQRRHTGG